MSIHAARATAIGLVWLTVCVVGQELSAQGPEFRGLWADAFHPGFKSSAQIDGLVSCAVVGHYNAIVAEVLAFHDQTGGGHGAYWNSAIVPKAGDISGNIDPLACLMQRAHASGIEVHAWLVPYRVGTTWPPSGNAVLQAHPEWAMTMWAGLGQGPSTIQGSYHLDPGSPDVQAYLIDIAQELITNYEVDGLQWDDLRYPQADAGYPADSSYADSGMSRYCRIAGLPCTSPPPPEGWPPWDDFRRRAINELVCRARAEIAALTANPRKPLRHTATLIDWMEPPVDFRGSEAYRLFQDWDLWLREGWLDAGCLLLLLSEGDSTQAHRYRRWVDWLTGRHYPRHVFVGLSAAMNTPRQLCDAIDYARGKGVHGVCIHSYATLMGFGSDWRCDSLVNPGTSGGCFGQVVQTPSMPWSDPTTAVEGTLWGRVIGMNSRPVDNAAVQAGTCPAVHTDANGYYVVTMIPAGATGTSCRVTAHEPPIISRRIQVSIVAGSLTRQDFFWYLDPGDFDGDRDVDRDDFTVFASCGTGAGIPYNAEALPPSCCLWVDADEIIAADFDHDNDVDQSDFGIFQRCYTGEDMPADPDCAG